MPKYRGYTRDFLQETMIDIPRKERELKEEKEKEELSKMDEAERLVRAKSSISMTERLHKMRDLKRK
jgi:hypothetical protein